MFAQQFDALADDGLVKFAFGVDGIAPERQSHDPQCRDGEISEAFERPLQNLQHAANIINKQAQLNSNYTNP